MSLPALNWKPLPTVNVAVNTAAGLRDAIIAALSSSTYLDGSIRTPGAGVAWTASLLSNNVVKCVPAGPNPMNLQALLGTGYTSYNQAMAHGATQMTSTLANQYLAVSLALDGDYLTDNVVNPVAGSGRFYGWGYASRSTTGSQGSPFSSVRLIESADVLCVQVVHADGIIMPAFMGAIVDPETGAAADAEVDGNLYGVITPGSGFNGTTDAYFHNSTTGYLGNSGGSNTAAGVFKPN